MTPITPESLHSGSYVTPEKTESCEWYPNDHGRTIALAKELAAERDTFAGRLRSHEARLRDLVSKHSNDAELGMAVRALVGGE